MQTALNFFDWRSIYNKWHVTVLQHIEREREKKEKERASIATPLMIVDFDGDDDWPYSTCDECISIKWKIIIYFA